MTKVLINGITGRMGQVLLKELENNSSFEVIGGIGRKDLSGIKVFKNTSEINEKVDVIIDFSTHESSMQVLEYAKNNNIPIVIATTGFTKEEESVIEDYSKEIAIFKSSNMSYEINIMCDIVASLAKKLNGADIEIVETHHRNKIDSPSGTALMLASSINNALNNEMEYTYDRHAVKEKRKDKEIGIHSIRGGNEVGAHSVLFFSENESFEITHNVTSRSVFASGAIKACEYILNKENGLYDMKDLIKG